MLHVLQNLQLWFNLHNLAFLLKAVIATSSKLELQNGMETLEE
jgi:hypothetical protein